MRFSGFFSPRARCFGALCLLASLVWAPAWAATGNSTQLARAQRATQVLTDIVDGANGIKGSLPKSVLQQAKAVVVIPGMLKVGLVLGGQRGKGLASVRGADGSWSQPNFVTMTGGSLGLQIGTSRTDVILIFRSQHGVDSLIHGKFTIGGDASAVAGPSTDSTGSATDAQMKADIYTYSRSRGVFAGVSVNGGSLSIDDAANAKVYGSGVTPRRIFEGGVSRVPAAVENFRRKLAAL